MNKKIGLFSTLIIIVLLLAGNPFFVVVEGSQAIITQFGDPIGRPITAAGLHLKIPFIQKVTYFQKRILEWDGFPNEIPTKDKRYIWIDTTARWKIVDALEFFKTVSSERGGQTILDGIIDAAVRDAITSQKSTEVIRSSNQLLENLKVLQAEEGFIDEGALEEISFGREKLRQEIVQKAREDLGTRYGIELIDVRIKRINYIEKVQRDVYERMKAERKRAAEQYRSEGRGIRADVEGRTGKDLKLILSEAYKEAQRIKGEADATATKIYADAYNKDPEFFSFLKTLETYGNTVDKNTTIILTTDGEYYKYLNKITP
ncbi:MAG: protease modulator HflC [Candidatus Omnitrophica bacterium]|nr:protease modulator HflC [Candidatus Omnitrophota bacterium]MBU2044448.1 protease modulator HflC [Candidatus Omnitrophota bacterium]MBU2251353.1 protease modulator HflC [Candidatus Omnitrophota bacterium]MBU2474078.1 protease modulator HflC [Candidatus Omnitrophota bacterium]